MGLMDKVKHLLFDEEEVVEVPVKSDELPKREVKKEEEFKSRGSFINHHENDEEEDPIKEIIVPKEKPVEIEKEVVTREETRRFNFPDDDDFDFMPRKKEEEVTTKYSRYSEFEPVKQRENKPSRGDYGLQENKDYKKLIEETEKKEKKPFTVTPPISPVYGYITVDENKVTREVKEEKKVINEPIRNFGPVSYNDQPISIEKEVKTDDFEIVEHDNVKDIIEDDFEDIKTSGIENEYLGNNNIEESFESTSELETISNLDNELKDSSKVDSDPQTIKESEEEQKENDALEDTIETDLFNLIDSMYKNEEDNENGEDE